MMRLSKLCTAETFKTNTFHLQNQLPNTELGAGLNVFVKNMNTLRIFNKLANQMIVGEDLNSLPECHQNAFGLN